MTTVETCELPPGALLRKYIGGGGYADAFTTQVPGRVSHAAFVEAFYTSRLFKLERAVLAVALRRPSTDAQATALAAGTRDSFAAWTVEARAPGQLLLADLHGRTRSWLMCEPVDDAAAAAATRLVFGSAVLPVPGRGDGKASMGWVFHALLRFHKRYSRALLRAAVARLPRVA